MLTRDSLCQQKQHMHLVEQTHSMHVRHVCVELLTHSLKCKTLQPMSNGHSTLFQALATSG